jgi:tetratricopeptide (TPR) repeat protein
MAIAEVSRLHMVASNFDQAIKWGERARILAERLDDKEVMIHVLNTVGCSHAQRGDIERGLAELNESLRLSLELDQPDNVERAYHNLGEVLIDIGNYAEARLIYEDYYNHNLLYHPDAEELPLLFLAFLDWLCGSWASAVDRIFNINRKRLFGIVDVWSRRFFGLIYNDLGMAADACQELESLTSSAVRTGELQTIVPHLGQLARAYDVLGRDTETLRLIQQYFEFIDGNPFFDKSSIMPLLFACHWYRKYSAPESLDEVRACVSRLLKAHEQFGTPEAEAALAEGSGSLALVEEHGPQAEEYFQDAVKIWEALGRPYDQARALGGYGQALANANDIDAGRLVLDQAWGIIESLAEQLEDSEMRSSFLASQLVNGVRQDLANLETRK